MSVILINGYPQSGKDKFVEYAQKYLDDKIVLNHSTVDLVKKYATLLGWDGVKDDKGRNLLATLKDMLKTYGDIPFKYSMNYIVDNHDENTIIFIHTRETEEIERFKKSLTNYNIPSCSLFIKRIITDEQFNNHADKNVEDYKYEYIMCNEMNGLEKYKKDVCNMMDIILEV